MVEEETPYADLEWAKEKEVGQIVTKTIAGKKWDFQAINDLTDQKLRDQSESMDDNGLPSMDTATYRKKFLKATVVQPVMSDQFIDFLRDNKKMGLYFQLYNTAAKISGINLTALGIEEEKN